jgi:outer membrane protein assembly factor BamB
MNPLIIGSNGSVAAIDPATGAILWQTKLDTGGGVFSGMGGQDISVLLKDGRIYAGGAGHLFCLDAATGQILWHNPLRGLGHNDLSLAMEGVAVQFMTKVERRNS